MESRPVTFPKEPAGGVDAGSALLRVEDLRVEFTTRRGTFPAVCGIDLSLRRGSILGLVGESGCGKSVTSLAVMGLLPEPPGRVAAGRIVFHDRDLLALPSREMSRLRGREISMVFQEPMTALNPVFTVGYQVAEVYRTHLRLGARESRERAVEMLARVGIPEPEKRARDYPHQMSGGMRQRILIAVALSCRPEVLIADEPTTALDVTVQAQILALLLRMRDEMETAVLLITHDFGVVAEVADEVAVMYDGRVVEQAPCDELFRSPWHPYTIGLLRSRPLPGGEGAGEGHALFAIPGTVPDPFDRPSGCPFEPRCERREPLCAERLPPLEEKAPRQWARCLVPP